MKREDWDGKEREGVVMSVGLIVCFVLFYFVLFCFVLFCFVLFLLGP